MTAPIPSTREERAAEAAKFQRGLDVLKHLTTAVDARWVSNGRANLATAREDLAALPLARLLDLSGALILLTNVVPDILARCFDAIRDHDPEAAAREEATLLAMVAQARRPRGVLP